MEESILWSTNGTGDGAADVTSSQWYNFFEMLFLSDKTVEGVAPRFLNALGVTSTGDNNARVASGGALVRGFLYRNTANVDLTIPSPAADTGFRVILRANWTAQTVRTTYILNTTGITTPPALTQTDGTTWEIPLASGIISAAGVISSLTQTGQRTYLHYNTQISTTMLEDDSVTNAKVADDAIDTAQIADNAVGNAQMANDAINTNEIVNLAVTTGKIAEDAVTKTKLANVYPELTDRQGSNVADWEAPGTTNYDVSQVTMQLGSIEIILGAGNDGDTVTVTFPAAFSNKPNISLSVQKCVSTGTSNVKAALAQATSLSATQLVIALFRRDPADTSLSWTAQIHWQAWNGDNS